MGDLKESWDASVYHYAQRCSPFNLQFQWEGKIKKHWHVYARLKRTFHGAFCVYMKVICRMTFTGEKVKKEDAQKLIQMTIFSREVCN